MAIDKIERKFIVTEPRLRREIGFQLVALILCPISFGFAVFNVAVSLLGYPALSSLMLASGSAFGLFALDQHYLIQARGDSSERIRKAMYKVRLVSITIITLSFVLMATDTFHEDIERVQAEARQSRRTELEQSPRYKLELDEAREGLGRAGQAYRRADELRTEVARLQVEQARAFEEKRNQCEGNTTGNETRRSGCGTIARGYDAAANRLGLEIEVARQELIQLGQVGERLAAARQRLAAIDASIDEETARAVAGPTQKLDALGLMLKTSVSAWFAVAFWFLIGLLPDLLMFVAQSRMFNHDLFARMRALRNEVLEAGIAQLRRDLRQQQADKLSPIEVRLAAVASLAASTRPAEAPSHAKTRIADQELA